MSYLLLTLLAACVVPIPEADPPADAGPTNSPPVIVEASPVMPFPQGATASGPIQLGGSPQVFSVSVRDLDLDDTLYVRVFRDYQKGPLGPLNEVQVANVGGDFVRTLELPTNTWCNLAEAGLLVFDVVVADRPFLTDPAQEPAYRALPVGAESSRMSWIGQCQ